MQDEPIDEHGPVSDADTIEHVTLHLLLDSELCPIWTTAEIARILRSDVLAADAVAALHDSGLVHRFEEFVFPTQSAIRFCQLARVI
jgi:hypothetical protein